MRIDNLRNRINKLSAKIVQEIEPWPPTADDGLSKLFYDANIRDGIPMPVERPDEPVLLFLIKAGAEKAFENYIEDDPRNFGGL